MDQNKNDSPQKSTDQQLGWVGNNPLGENIQDLRRYLQERNGIRDLAVCAPTQIARARELFLRDGFVVVRDVLTSEQLTMLRQGVERVVGEMLAIDQNRDGNRGSHRYSFGGASRTGNMLHHPEWTQLIDLPTVTPILAAIFGSKDFILRGGGGDFCLPGAVDYQPLHSDMADRTVFDLGNNKEFVHGSFSDAREQLTHRDLPAPYVCCNFLTVDFTATNGPTRQIPGTQHSKEPMPSLEDEPERMKLSTVCPATAGSVLIRDVRAWHGGTPNLSNELRAIPNLEYFAPWYRERMPACLPRALYDSLSEHGQDIARYIVAAPGESLDTGYRRLLGGTPPDSKSRPVNAEK